MTPEEDIIKVGFPFYPADLKAMENHLDSLEKAGVSARQGTLVRAVVCMYSATQLFAHALLMHESQKARGGLIESENFEDRIVVRLPESQIEKLEDVVRDLAAKGFSAKQSYIVRAAFRALPTGAALVDLIKEFNEKFPNRPRGLPAAQRKKAKKHG